MARIKRGEDVCHLPSAERMERDPQRRDSRVALAKVWAALEMDRADAEAARRVLRYTWGGLPTGRTTGRPRERWRTGDLPRIAAGEVRRQAVRDGLDPSTLAAVEVDGDPGGVE